MRAKDIVKGEFKEIKGIVKDGRDVLVLCEWTTGNCYIPYELMKKKFPKELLEYFMSIGEFVKFK